MNPGEISMRRLFSLLMAIEPPVHLYARILERVRRFELRRLRLSLAASATLFATSLTGLFFSLRFLISELSASGFLTYITLPFSDGADVLHLANDFTYLIIESTPVLGLLLVFLALTALLASIKTTSHTLYSALFGRKKNIFA